MTKRTACIAALASLLAACEEPMDEIDAGMDGGPAPVDAGPPFDAGPDAGPRIDAGADAGPPPYFTGRLVNNIPGMPAVEVCVWTSAGGTIIGGGTHVTAGDLNVPFRGVSSYIGTLFQALGGIDYLLALYDEATFNVRMGCGGAGEPMCTCPADPMALTAPPAALIGLATSDQFMAGHTYTIVAGGFAEGTFGAAADELPSRCGAAYDSPCTAATQLVVVEDDLTSPAAGMVKIRVSNQVPNVSPAHFLVCYDADIIPDMTAPGNCLEPADVTAAEALTTSSVGYGTVTDYAERSPILPTGALAAGVGGGIYLAPVAPGTTSCPTFTANAAVVMHTRCYPILGLDTPPSDPPFPATVRAHVADGDIITLFISGALSATPDPNFGPAFFLWQDNYVPPGP